MAGYHQFHVVQVAVGETLRAAELHRVGDRIAEPAGRYEAGKKPGGKPGDRRVGVVWHTQGSGKSLTMAFYAGRIIREPAMENPTIVMLTDRLHPTLSERCNIVVIADEAHRSQYDFIERKEKLKTRWAQLEAVVGAEKRLAIVARDIVEHFDQRCQALDGKAMVVCMSRRICASCMARS